MSEKPLISVIVPLYKCESFVEECLNSLKRQTEKSFEVVCVNDASPDNSLEVAQSCAGQDKRFRFVSLPKNSGLSAARNAGINEARGKIIVLLDSDDYLTDNALELISERFERQTLDSLYFNAKPFYEDAAASRIQLEDFSRRPSFDECASGIDLFSFLESHDQFFPNAALQAFRLDFLNDNSLRFEEGILHEDVVFTFHVVTLAKRSSYLSEPIYMRRVRSESIMTASHTIRNVEGHFIGIKFLNDWTKEHISSLKPEFLEASAHRIDDYGDLCARYWAYEITDEDKKKFTLNLSPEDRFFFEQTIGQRARLLRVVYDSLSWKLGRKATALPRALSDWASRRKQAR